MPKVVIRAAWGDAPHLTDELKASVTVQPHQRDARTKGIPYLGAGRIYPKPEEEIMVEDFVIPTHWPRGYAMDVGWRNTAAIWLALDRETTIRYLYAEYYAGQAEPLIHAAGIKAKGVWIPGKIDPAARGRSQIDGKQLFKMYGMGEGGQGLRLGIAPNAVEAGIYQVLEMFATGQLKVFKSCQHFFAEYRVYRRLEGGQVVKRDDHCLDCLRYAVLCGIDWLETQPIIHEVESYPERNIRGDFAWMQ